MIGASILMFSIAAPRSGEVVSFLRGRYGLQTTYVIGLILLFVLGGAITIDNWN
jgi:hypothetical protein